MIIPRRYNGPPESANGVTQAGSSPRCSAVVMAIGARRLDAELEVALELDGTAVGFAMTTLSSPRGG